MKNEHIRPGFDRWWTDLTALAAKREVAWVLGPSPAPHRAAYEAGRTPEEELQTLADMCEWRGCGCGGS